MPTPNENESESDFVSRCIPIVINEGTASDNSQAAAICHSIYSREKIASLGVLSIKEVERLCPQCAKRMRRQGLTAIHSRDIAKMLIKQNDPERICGDIWSRGTESQRDAFGNGTEGRSREQRPPESWWSDCTSTVTQ